MSSPDARDPHAADRARVERDLDAAVDSVRWDSDEDHELSYASWLTERLRQAMLTAGERRGSMAGRIRERRNLTFTEMGRIMSVTRARAAEIVDKARKRDETVSLPVVALAVITGPRGVLLSKRTDRTPPWSFIGGEVESGEEAMQAAVREVREETGAEAMAAELIGRRTHPATGREVAYVACRLADPAAEVSVSDTAELAEVRWADLGDARLLMPNLFAPVDAYLARVLG